MMKNGLTKRPFALLLAILLAILLAFGICFPASAAQPEAEPRISFVAYMTIVATREGTSSIGLMNGHAFLIFENVSDSEITVGHMSVPAGESITIGTYGNIPTHHGIWYNTEAYAEIRKPYYGVLTGVVRTELSSVNRYINTHNIYSATAFNCAGFASGVWNTVYEESGISGGTPTALVDSIRSNPGYLTNPSLSSCSINDIAYHTADSLIYDTADFYHLCMNRAIA